MLSKRKIPYLIFLSMAFIFACTASDFIPTPTETSVPKSTKTPSHEVKVPENCYRDNLQTFLSPNRDYCFAHPRGYFLTQESAENNLILKHAPPASSDEIIEATPSIEEIEKKANTVIVETSIRIEYTKTKDKPAFQQFATAHKEKNGYQNELQETFISAQSALTIRETNFETKGEGENKVETVQTRYVVYLEHSNNYYIITISSKALKGYDIETQEAVADLFFPLQNTFMFLP